MWNYVKNLFGFGEPVDPCNGSKVCQALAKVNEAYESLPDYSLVSAGVAVALVGAGFLASRLGSKEGVVIDVDANQESNKVEVEVEVEVANKVALPSVDSDLKAVNKGLGQAGGLVATRAAEHQRQIEDANAPAQTSAQRIAERMAAARSRSLNKK